jgi:hypothetical protein
MAHPQGARLRAIDAAIGRRYFAGWMRKTLDGLRVAARSRSGDWAR